MMSKEDKKYLILLGITVAAGYLFFKYSQPRNFNATGSKIAPSPCIGANRPPQCITKCSDSGIVGKCTCLGGTPSSPQIYDCSTGALITTSV